MTPHVYIDSDVPNGMTLAQARGKVIPVPGGWAAIRNGVTLGIYRGVGGKRRARARLHPQAVVA